MRKNYGLGWLVLLLLLVASSATYAQTNLVANSSFETLGPDGLPANWGQHWGTSGPVDSVNIYVMSDGAADGLNYVFIEDKSKESAAVFYSDPILVTAGATYTVGIKCKSRSSLSVRLRTFSTADSGPMETKYIVNNLAVNIPAGDGPWVEYRDVHVIPDGVEMVRFVIYTSKTTLGSGAIDSVVLYEGSHPL